MESVEVRPRFQEPDAPSTPAPVQQQIVNQPADTSQVAAPVVPAAKGLFTSMYENKIIVLIIVVAIVIIGIIAYVIYRKPEEEPDKSKSAPKGGAAQGENTQAQNNNPQQPVQNNNPTPAAQNTQNNTPTQSDQTNNPNPPPPKSTALPKTQNGKMDRNNIMNLLERSKNGTAAKPAPVTQPQNVKSEDEIMQLMEDEEEQNGDEPEENTNENEEPENPPAQESNLQPTNSNAQGSPYCNFVLPTRRTCRNKVKSNGKCHLHGG